MSLMEKASLGVRLMTRHNDITMVMLLVVVVALMIVPLPTPLVDTLIGVNMTLSFLMLMMSMYVKTALDFSSFPTMLLFTTLFLFMGYGIARLAFSRRRDEPGPVFCPSTSPLRDVQGPFPPRFTDFALFVSRAAAPHTRPAPPLAAVPSCPRIPLPLPQ